MHKRSATYFFDNWRNSKKKAKQQVGAGEMVSIAVQTAVVDVSDEAGRTATRTKMRTGTSGSSRADAPDHRARRSV